MVDVGLIVGAIAILLSLIGIGLGGYSLTKSGSEGPRGPAGPVGPIGPAGPPGSSSGGSGTGGSSSGGSGTGGSGTCPSDKTPTCDEFLKLKKLLEKIDITDDKIIFNSENDNSVIFKSSPKFEKRINIGDKWSIGPEQLYLVFRSGPGDSRYTIPQDTKGAL